MILRQATIKYSGTDPNSLSKWAKNRICVSCDNCGRVRWVRKDAYRSVCNSCANHLSGIKRYQLPIPKFVKEEDRFIPNTNIDRIKTIEKCGYDPIDLCDFSHKFIYIICDNCKKYKNVRKYACYSLCESCSTSGKNNPAWKGGISNDRDHILPEKDCTKLNQRFKGSEMHHIMKSVVVYLPKYLHNRKYGISHDLKNNKNMNKINRLAMDYLVGDY